MVAESPPSYISSPSYTGVECGVENVDPVVQTDTNNAIEIESTTTEATRILQTDTQLTENSSQVPQSPIKMSFPVYSGFAQLNNDATIGSLEENNAKQFFYQNRYVT
jgi:hypothetical protein